MVWYGVCASFFVALVVLYSLLYSRSCCTKKTMKVYCSMRISQGPSFGGRATARIVTARFIYYIALLLSTAVRTWYVRLLDTYACRQEMTNRLTLMLCGHRLLPMFTSNNERQLIDVTVVRRVRPRAEGWCDYEGHRRWKRACRTLFCN